MWRFSRPSLRVGLAPESLTIHASPGAPIEVPIDAGAHGERWQVATEAFAQAMAGEPAWKGATVKIALSHRWVRFFTVPWHDDLMQADSARSYVARFYAAVCGDGADSGATFAIEQGGRGQPRNVCAIDSQLMTACADALRAANARLAWLGPWLVPAIARSRQLGDKGRGDGWFVTVEPGTLTLATVTANAVRQVQVHSCESDWSSAVLREVRRAGLREGRPNGQPIWIASLLPLPAGVANLPETMNVVETGSSPCDPSFGHLAGVLA